VENFYKAQVLEQAMAIQPMAQGTALVSDRGMELDLEPVTEQDLGLVMVADSEQALDQVTVVDMDQALTLMAPVSHLAMALAVTDLALEWATTGQEDLDLISTVATVQKVPNSITNCV
jgi:hypothetical protein